VGVSLATYRRNEEIEQEFTDTGVMIAVGKQR
jgi:sodium/proline symporter